MRYLLTIFVCICGILGVLILKPLKRADPAPPPPTAFIPPIPKPTATPKPAAAAPKVAPEPPTAPHPMPAQEDFRIRPSYRSGFSDGYLVGKTDALEGRARDGMKAIRLGKIHAQDHDDAADQKAYASGYHEGYNEGWHARKRYEDNIRGGG